MKKAHKIKINVKCVRELVYQLELISTRALLNKRKKKMPQMSHFENEKLVVRIEIKY
jgi:hypothetical protein